MVDQLTISEFARLCGISTSALRFYDRCGVLVPDQVDAGNGYRSYARDQVPDASLLRDLRLLGLSISEISQFKVAPAPAQLDFIRAHLARLDRQNGDAHEIAAQLRQQLVQETKETTMSTITLAAAAVEQALRQVQPALSSARADPILNNVLVEAREGSLRLVATDRYRLAVRDLVIGHGAPSSRALLGRPQLAELQRALAEGGSVSFDLDTNEVTVDGADSVIALDPAAADFPVYERILQASTESSQASVARSELVDALDALGDATPIRFRFEVDRLVVQSDEGADVEIRATYEGPNMTVGLNGLFALAAAELSVGPDLVLEVSQPTEPVTFRSADDGSYIHMVMPVQLSARGS